MNLNNLGLKYETDKSSNWHNYLKYYDLIFNPIKDNKIKLLEIGIWGGASLLMWKDYFPNGEITGMDIEEKQYLKQDRINIYKGDQSNKEDLWALNRKYGFFDIIIDDGSHYGHHQKISFETLFPLLNSGGYYVIEDCLCSYNNTWNSDVKIMEYVKELIDAVNMNGKLGDILCANKERLRNEVKDNYISENIEYIFTSCGTVIIKKF